MKSVNRRTFLGWSAATGAAALAAGHLHAADTKPTLQKALIVKDPTEKILTDYKAAGFEGVESTDRGASPEKAAAARKVAEKLGMRIHSVMYGWANFNKPSDFDKDLASVKVCLEAAKAYGADAILLVPCRIGGMAMPEAWEFDIRFDEKTNHVKQVVSGDNGKYAAYIEAHNQAIDATRDAVRKLIPAAEKAGVVIALENVWNNLWVKPALFANFVASFDNPWAKAYFDIGNHVKYAPPEEWIAALGKLIVKCHVKDFKLNADGHGGKFCNIRDGSVRWPVVLAALKKIGYDGWMTIEGGNCKPDEHSRRLDAIIAGQ